MKAATFAGPGKIILSNVDREAPPPGWVRLGINAVGICGSDLHLLEGEAFPNNGLRPGHEVAGVIDAVGDGVDLTIGDQVTFEPLKGCGSCYDCRVGFINRCADLSIVGVHEAGGMAEYLNVPASLLYPLPADLDPTVGALSEPMAVSYRGLRLGDVKMGSRVAVLGAGTIGLLCVLAAKDAGAGDIHVTARYPHQAELAKALGATEVYADSKALVAALGRQHIDVTLETVGGKSDTLVDSVNITRPGGTIVMLGLFEGPPDFPAFEFLTRELTLIGSACYARDARDADFGYATELVARHRSLLPEMVTHRFSLDQLEEAFATAGDKTTGAIKVQIMPGL